MNSLELDFIKGALHLALLAWLTQAFEFFGILYLPSSLIWWEIDESPATRYGSFNSFCLFKLELWSPSLVQLKRGDHVNFVKTPHAKLERSIKPACTPVCPSHLPNSFSDTCLRGPMTPINKSSNWRWLSIWDFITCSSNYNNKKQIRTSLIRLFLIHQVYHQSRDGRYSIFDPAVPDEIRNQ